MPRFFTHYWTNRTWDDLRYEEGTPLNHTASNLFTSRGIQPGDHVYVITVINGRLFLLSKMVVHAIGDAPTIARLRGYRPEDLWPARDHLIAAQATPMHFDRPVPLTITKQLRFQRGGITKGLFFKTTGVLDGQTLRGVRELTEASALLLDNLMPPLQPPLPDTAAAVSIEDERLMGGHGLPSNERIIPMPTNGAGITPDLQAYHQSIDDELRSIRNRIRNLIGDAHWPTDGAHKEAIVRRVLRNHMPERIRVGTGFVCYAGGEASTQMDILLTDTHKPTLFKDDELVIVTADAVQGVIEVKTRQDTSQLKNTLEQLAKNAAEIRQHAQSERCLVGLFVHDADGLSGKAVLRALQKAAGGNRDRAIDFVAIGSRIFAQYSERVFIGKGGEAPLWYLYDIDQLAPAYFISHFVWRSTADRPTAMRFAWFPLQGEIVTQTRAWISLYHTQVHEIEPTLVSES